MLATIACWSRSKDNLLSNLSVETARSPRYPPCLMLKHLALWPLILLGCSSDPPSPSPSQSQERQSYEIVPEIDPEDVYCGEHCEPYSSSSCTAVDGKESQKVCSPGGFWGSCGGTDWEPRPSQCAKGTQCVHRCSGCNMGCRAICIAVPNSPEAACESGLVRVQCEAPAPNRAKDAKCTPSEGENSYCCPKGAAILNQEMP